MTLADRWFLMYAQIVGIQHHPRNDERDRMTPEQCVRATDAYMDAFKRRKPEEAV